MNILKLMWKSLNNRKMTAMLTIFTIAVSVALLLGVERIKTQAKENFANTISGTDLIVGARSGQINLLLYSIFRIGNATNNISWKSVEYIKNQPNVVWTIPISLGDSHHGYSVLGTTNDYFEHFKFSKRQPLTFKQGENFTHLFSTVVGFEVAKKLGYKIGDKLLVAHGLSDKHFTRHKGSPFTISGILEQTGTPIDRTIHVSLKALDAVHHTLSSKENETNNEAHDEAYHPRLITALMVGLNSRIKTLSLQRQINDYRAEPLTAIIPGLALHELWQMMAIAEKALFLISIFVIIAGLLGMLSSLLTSLNERRREMAILRAMGARPLQIFLLLSLEAFFLTLVGIISGIILISTFMLAFSPWLLENYGIVLSISLPTFQECILMLIILFAGLFIGFLPAFRAYRQSLSDGMTIRV